MPHRPLLPPLVLVHSAPADRTEGVCDVGEAGSVKGRERENIHQVSKEGYEGASDTEEEDESEDDNAKEKSKKHKKSE